MCWKAACTNHIQGPNTACGHGAEPGTRTRTRIDTHTHRHTPRARQQLQPGSLRHPSRACASCGRTTRERASRGRLSLECGARHFRRAVDPPIIVPPETAQTIRSPAWVVGAGKSKPTTRGAPRSPNRYIPTIPVTTRHADNFRVFGHNLPNYPHMRGILAPSSRAQTEKMTRL